MNDRAEIIEVKKMFREVNQRAMKNMEEHFKEVAGMNKTILTLRENLASEKAKNKLLQQQVYELKATIRAHENEVYIPPPKDEIDRFIRGKW